MKRKVNKKLSLNKTTIVNLERRVLQNVKGGIIIKPYETLTCNAACDDGGDTLGCPVETDACTLYHHASCPTGACYA